MRERKALTSLIIAINVIGMAGLICFAIPYLTHSVAIVYPNAMLPAEAWDRAGMALTFSFVPLLLVNVLCFVFIKVKQKPVRLLFFIPSVLCLAMVVSYWATSLR